MPEEEPARPRLAARLKGCGKRVPFFSKIIELILCVVSAGLVVDPFNKIPQNMNTVGLVHVGVGGYILINAVLIVGHLLGDKFPKKTAIIFSGLAAVLCCSGGLLLIHDRPYYPNTLISEYMDRHSDRMLASGFFAVLAALVFLLDAYFTNKHE